MERNEKRSPVMSVPQFGGWDQNAPGATDYSVVFTKARANKKHQKTNLTEITSKSLGNEAQPQPQPQSQPQPHHHHHHHHHARAPAPEDPAVMGKKRILTYIHCCVRP